MGGGGKHNKSGGNRGIPVRTLAHPPPYRRDHVLGLATDDHVQGVSPHGTDRHHLGNVWFFHRSMGRDAGYRALER